MKYNPRETPIMGTRRIIKKYLIIPIMLNNEWRWLESAKIEQEYTFMGWYNMSWANNKKITK